MVAKDSAVSDVHVKVGLEILELFECIEGEAAQCY